MRATYKFALFATAIGLATATPALATATLQDQSGPDLNTKIHASKDDPLVAPNTGDTVDGNDSTGAGHNVIFDGFLSFDNSLSIATNLANTGTSIHITDGGGFAQINDTDFVNNGDISTNNWFAMVMDPDPAFTAYEFSVMLNLQGNDTSNIFMFYMLTGGSTWIAALPGGLPTGGGDNQFILNGLDPGQSFDKILLVSPGADIFQVKQNSIDELVASVPEPASWALMLLGFGGIGMALRRSRKRSPALMQVA